LLAAAFLLLGVAARRLAVPDFITHATAATSAWLGKARKRKPKLARTKRASAETLQSLRDAKTRSEAARPSSESETAQPRPLPPLAAPTLARAVVSPSSTSATSTTPASVPPRFSQPPPSSGNAVNRPAARKPTAAEVLLARRRGRKP
jgi:hypothetical protein